MIITHHHLKKLLMIFFVGLLSLFFVIDSYSKVSETTKIQWHQCPSEPDFLCANLQVPLDYETDTSTRLILPLKMHRAKKTSRGYLLFNFGGPWANNVAILPSMIKRRLTPTMINHYNLIVVNPRGVKPNPIKCKTNSPKQLKIVNESLKKIYAQGDITDSSKLFTLMTKKHKLCHYNALSQYASTYIAAKDIETLRKALEIDKLNMYMDSYGTRLGLAYLVNYPEHVNRIILDGNIAPSNAFQSLVEMRAYGALITFNAFFEYCKKASKKCPLNQLLFYKSQADQTHLKQVFKSFLGRVSQSNGLPTSMKYQKRRMNKGMIQNVMYTEMQPSQWKNLANALYLAINNNSGDALMKIYIQNTGYHPSTNSYPIHSADSNATKSSVMCKGYVMPDFSQRSNWLSFTAQLQKKYTTVGTVAALWLAPICIHWQAKSIPLLPVRHNSQPFNEDNLPNVLIIGNAIDPMTPFKNALAVKHYLSQMNIPSSIVKWNAVSHTALITDSPISYCVFNQVDHFLQGKHITAFKQCYDWKNPFNA